MTSTPAIHPDPMTLAEFGLGRLSDTESAPIEEHLADCDHCRLLLELSPADALVARVKAVAQPAKPLVAVNTSPLGYEILEELGRGGMGVVYKARDQRLNRIVALKMLREGLPVFAEDSVRFRAEAEAVARLRHPNIVQIYEVGERLGQPYLALEYVEGGTLAQRLAGQPLPGRDAASLVETLARAVDYAHSQGVVHRDLKPTNVLVESGKLKVESENTSTSRATSHFPLSNANFHFPISTAKIVDFGLAKQVDRSDGPTRTGAILGTPSYMAPEQAAGAATVGPSADIYALGAILYECLTGRPPFRAATALETLDQVRGDDPVSVRTLQPRTPRDLETICLKCLRKEPRERYASAAELAEDLERFDAGHPISARRAGMTDRLVKWARRRPALAALVLVAMVAPLVAVAAATAHNVRLRGEADRADRERDRAAEHYRQARGALRQVLALGAPVATPPGTRVTDVRLRQLEEALPFYRAAVDAAPADLQARFDLAGAHLAAAQELTHQSQTDRVLPHLHVAQELLEGLTQARPDDVEYQVHLGACFNNFGFCHGSLGRPDLGEKYHRAAFGVRERISNTGSLNRRRLAESCINLGAAHLATARLDDAVALFRRAEGIWTEEHRQAPDAATARNLAECRINLALLTLKADRLEEAAAAYADIDRLIRPQVDSPLDGVTAATSLAGAYSNWANLLRQAGRTDEMFAKFAEAEALLTRVAERSPTWHDAQHMRYNLHGARAQANAALNRYADELRDWHAAVAAAPNAAQGTLVRVARLFTYVKMGNHKEATTEAVALHERTDINGADQYNLACVFGRCIPLAGSDSPLVSNYTRRALACLSRSRALDFFKDRANIDNMLKDDDLAAIRSHPEFQKLLGELQTAR